MNNIYKQVLKNNYYNYKTLVIIISFIILVILSTRYSFFLYPLFLICIIIIMSIISFTNEVKFLKEVYSYKNGTKKIPYKPITINIEKLIDIIKIYGLPLTYIKIENIYAIEVVKIEDRYNCYIDELEFTNLEDFLNYKLDDKALKDIDRIKILMFNNDDPKNIKV